MRDSHPQLLDAFLKNTYDTENDALLQVKQRAVVLQKINRTVKDLLPVQLQSWCRVANYREHILVLEVASASWMMRLRYEQSHLLCALRAQILPSLSSIDIKINPALMIKGTHMIGGGEQNKQKPIPLRRLSQESAKELRMLAAVCPEKLRHTIEKLAALAF